VTGTLSSSGAATLASAAVTAALTVGTTLGVTGAATLSSTLAVTGAATLSSTLAVTGIASFTGVLRGPDGAVGAPAYSFSSDTDTGIYSGAADNVSIATGGTSRFSMSTSQIITTIPLRGPDGSQGAPSLSFSSDTNTGLYAGAADELYFSEGGSGHRIGFRVIPRTTTGGTLTSACLGRCVSTTSAVTINTSVFEAGDCFTVYNDSASAFNITQGAGITMRLAGTTTTGTLSLAPRGFATCWFESATEVIVSGNVS
jgi:hypothetical protein